jgi:hypothetical protein
MPAGPALAKLLGYATISKAILLTTQGIPKLLPPAFYASHTKCVRDAARWRRYSGQRRVPQKVRYGAPAVEAELKEVGEGTAKCIHFFEKESLDPLVFNALQQPNSYEHDAAGYEVQRQLEAFAMKFENVRTAACILALGNGALNFDSKGNLMPTALTAPGTTTLNNATVTVAEVVNFRLNPNNVNQLNGIISSSWASPTSDIPLHLRRIKKQARRQTGYPLKIALYGENIPSYFYRNESLQQYLARHPVIRAEFLEGITAGEIPDGLFGFTWIPVYESFYEDQNGVNQDLWNNPDQITFTPDVSEEWWDVIEGTFAVPTTLNIVADGLAAARSLKNVVGMGGYGCVIHDPPSVQGRYFDTFLPTLKNPDVIFSPDVAF